MGYEYKFRSYGIKSNLGNRFATKEEMEKSLTRIDLTGDLPLNGGGAPVISDTNVAYIDKDDYHMLILGSTGSMKTRAVILPTIHTLAKSRENMVITDPKGEIYESTSGILKEKGYDVTVLNLRDMAHSDCWNPLEEAYKVYHEGDKERGINLANEFSDALVAGEKGGNQEPYWINSANQVMHGVLKILLAGAKSPEEACPASIPLFYRYLDSSDRDSDSSKFQRMHDFVLSLPETSPIHFDLENIVSLTPVTKSGVLSHFSEMLAPFTKSKSLQAITSRSTINLHDFSDPEKKVVLFLIVPDEDTSLHFLVASLIKQLYTIAIRDASAMEDNKLPRRLNFLLDEFANIPRIPDMESMITAARSRNIRFYLVVQSDAQLHEKYGASAEIIKTNCLDWVYLNSKEDNLIRQVSSMIGTGSDGKPLVSYQELGTLKKTSGIHSGTEAIFLMTRSRPYLTFLPDISRYQTFSVSGTLPLPETSLEFNLFDLEERIFSLPRKKRLEIYGDAVPGKKDKEEEDKEEEKESEEEPVDEAVIDFDSFFKKVAEKANSSDNNEDENTASSEDEEDYEIETDGAPYREDGKEYNLKALHEEGITSIRKSFADGKRVYILFYRDNSVKPISPSTALLKGYIR